jgi:hypothetical protein
VKNIVIKYAFLQGMLIPYSSQNRFIYLNKVCKCTVQHHQRFDTYLSAQQYRLPNGGAKGHTVG